MEIFQGRGRLRAHVLLRPARSGVVEKQEKCVVPVSKNGSTVHDLQHPIHLHLIQVSDVWFRSLLDGIARTSALQPRCSGLRSPINLARELIAASRGFRSRQLTSVPDSR